MKLYYAPGACSLSPHIVAKEAGLDLELNKVNLKDHTTQDGQNYYDINSKGYVPALKLDSGRVLTEGPAIVQYMADQKPDSGLLPNVGSAERYEVVEWLTFINSEIHKSFSPLFGDASNEAKGEATAKIKKRFAYVSENLGGNEFLTGATFTVADAYFFVTLRWADRMRIDLPSNLREMRERVANRPKVREALSEEGLT